MIYAVSILDNMFVKIGYAGGDVYGRIAQLQTGCPFEIKLLFAVEGSLIQEKEIHSALTSAFGRVRIPMPPNEWYPGSNGFFSDFLENLRSGANFGLAYADRYNPNVKQASPRVDRQNIDPNIKWPKLKKYRPIEE